MCSQTITVLQPEREQHLDSVEASGITRIRTRSLHHMGAVAEGSVLVDKVVQLKDVEIQWGELGL